jgi:hypothetical protein
MANGQGGYRKPSNPKAFSGQGAQSQRTDGGPSMAQQPIRPMDSGGVYGERKAMNEMQAGAPMAGDPLPTSPPLPPVPGMFDETQMPNQPVTAGNPLGAGAGPEALSLPNTTPSITSTLRRIAQNDPTGEAEYALMMLSERGIV